MDICNYKTNHHFLQAILSSSPSFKNIDTSSIDLSSIDSNHYLVRDLDSTETSRISYKFYQINDKNLIDTKDDDFYRLTNLSKISYSEKLLRMIRHNYAIEIFNGLLTTPKYKEKPSSHSINHKTNNDLDVEDAVFAFSCFDQRHYELLLYRQLALTLVPVIERNSTQASCLKNPTQGINLIFNTFDLLISILHNNFILRVYAGEVPSSSACLVAIMSALVKQFSYKVDVVSFQGTFMLRVYDPDHSRNNNNDLNIEDEHDDSIDDNYVYCEFGGFGFKSYTIPQLKRRLHESAISFKRKYIELISIFQFMKILLHQMDFEILVEDNRIISVDRIQHRNNVMLELLMTKLVIHKYNRDISVNNNNDDDIINHDVNMNFTFEIFFDYDYARRFNGVDYNEGSFLPLNVSNYTAELLMLTDHLCEAFPESSKVLERLINAPLNSIYPRKHLFFKTLSHIHEKRRYSLSQLSIDIKPKYYIRKVLKRLIHAPLNSIYPKTHLFFKTLNYINKRKRDYLSQLPPIDIKPKYYVGQVLKHGRNTGIVLLWSIRTLGSHDQLARRLFDHTYSASYINLNISKPEIYYELIYEK